MLLRFVESSIDFGFLFFLFSTLFTNGRGLTSVQYKSCSVCIQQKDHLWCEPKNHTLLTSKNESCIRAATPAPSSGNCEAIYPEQSLLAGASPVVGPSDATAYDYANVLSSSVGGDRRPRVGDQMVLNFTFTDIDKALDVYYLLDCTKSMSKHRSQVRSQGKTLEMVFKGLNLTNNYQIGLGTFVDKLVVPFGSFKSKYENRTAEYTFKNNMRLESDVTKFIDELANVKTYTSLDDPEATLEALMQALVCEDRIGWRANATKIVIVATDQPFHIAGMGKLAGILKPNDEECHIDSEGNYNEWSKQDYPSINQIARAIHRTGINVLFAVGSAEVENSNGTIENCTEGYRLLKESLNEKLQRHSGAAHHVHMVELGDEAGIVSVLSNTYKKIRSEIRFFHQLQGFTREQEDRTKVTYDFNCGLKGWVFDRPRVECDNVSAGVTIQFAIKIPIDVTLCKTQANKKIRIFQSGELTSVGIDINPICQCSCESQKTMNSSNCSGNGDFVCGVCECKEGYNGTDCSCRKTDDVKENCEEQVGGATVVCSNKGTCKCGKCVCEQGFSGKLCEFNCDQCFEHGKCENGGCACDQGFTGTFCQCRNKDTSCRDPITEEICGLSEAGRGQCRCSDQGLANIPRNKTVHMSCKCPDDYTGTFCEVCQSAACLESTETSNSDADLFGVCSDEGLRLLVTEAHETGWSPAPECQSVPGWKTLVQLEWGPEGPKMGYCFFMNNETECSFGYWYAFKDSKCLVLRTHDSARNCPDVSIWYIIGGTVGGIIFAGIVALVIWKICMYFQDKREWEMFNRNLENINWTTSGDNKIFKPALTTTVNPIFGNNRMSRLFNRKSMMVANGSQ